MSVVTRARWWTPRHWTVSGSTVMPSSLEGALEDGPGVLLGDRTGVGADAGVAARHAGHRVEVLLLDPAVAQPGRQAEPLHQADRRPGRVARIAQRRADAAHLLGNGRLVEAHGVG